MGYVVGQYIEKDGRVGKILTAGPFVYSVRVGEYARATWNVKDAISKSSEEEYNSQIAKEEVELQSARESLKQTRKVFRWLCLSCNARHNGYQCPTCGGTDKIYNTDRNTADASVLADLSPAEPYTPRDE